MGEGRGEGPRQRDGPCSTILGHHPSRRNATIPVGPGSRVRRAPIGRPPYNESGPESAPSTGDAMTDLRRNLSPLLGLLEIVLATGIFLLGLGLPARDDVRRGFDGARRVTSAAGDQVQGLREQVAELRRSRLRQSADR